MLMPKRPLPELLLHDDWYTQHRLMQRRRRDVVEAWGRERAQFLDDSSALLQESAALAAERAAQAAER